MLGKREFVFRAYNNRTSYYKAYLRTKIFLLLGLGRKFYLLPMSFTNQFKITVVIIQ